MNNLPELRALGQLTRDGRLLILGRLIRLFAFGASSVVLALYFTEIGLSVIQVGLLLSAILVGDTILSLLITAGADRIGRRRMLLASTGLMLLSGMTLAFSTHLIWIVLAAIIGTLSPTGNEVGPFLSIEQASLPQTTSDQHRTSIFAWYNLLGSLSTAFGALVGGSLVGMLQSQGYSALISYRVIFIVYASMGMLLAFSFYRLSKRIEPPPRTPLSKNDLDENGQSNFLRRLLGLHRSQKVVLKLSGLYMLDAFGGGLMLQSLLAYWFYTRFGLSPVLLGSTFFGANLLAGISALVAARIAAKIGLLNTMVFTHIPSNLLLMIVPLMPSAWLAVMVVLLRFSISQMDVPTRQSYAMAIVDADERSAAAGLTSIARTAASAVAPTVTGQMFSMGFFSLPFWIGGGLKIVYDLILFYSFKSIKPPEEQNRL